MKINGTFVKVVIAGLAGLGAAKLYSIFASGEEYEADDYVEKELEKERTEENVNALLEYDYSKKIKDDLEKRERSYRNEAVRNAKAKIDYDKTLANAKANMLSELDEFKKSIEYDKKIAKADTEMRDKIALDTELWYIEEKKAKLQRDKNAAKSRYELKKSVLGYDDADKEYAKLLKRDWEDAKDSYKKEIDILDERKDAIEKKYKEERDRSLEDLKASFKAKKESLTSQYKLKEEEMNATVDHMVSAYDHKIVSTRSEEEAEVLNRWDYVKQKRDDILENEKNFKEHILDKMDQKDRIAMYMADNNCKEKEVKGLILFVAGTFLYFVGGGFIKAFRYSWDVAGRVGMFQKPVA